ncbi:MAG: TonB-dependent receptor plug domain-containing protein [Candidatus Thiodiazotropha sp. (ex Ctena orbiculata)]|nr:TonB-dependent receptor plug domain-containing protein [Candidatus Thiodiazotropha taylori]
MIRFHQADPRLSAPFRLSLIAAACLTAQLAIAEETVDAAEAAEVVAENTQVAAQGAVELPALSVIDATRSNVTLKETPKAITVIDQKQLDTTVTTGGIQQMLTEVPGVDYARTGGLGGQLVLRGFGSNSKRSLLTVDGERFRGRSTLEFNMFDPAMIERIEVIRGPASSVYGADAMNGVVNIVTRRADVDYDADFSLSANIRSLEYNSVNNSFGGRAEAIGGGDGFDLLLGANYREGDDYETPIGTAENSAFEAKSLDFKLGYKPSDHTRWELDMRSSETTTERAGGLGASPGAPYKTVKEDPITEQYLKLSYEDTNYAEWADRFYASAYVRKLDTDIYVNGGAVHLKVDTPTVWGGRFAFNKALDSHHLSWGGDIFHEEFGGRYAVLPHRC